MTGERQANRIRSLYLESVLTQDMEFFDTETKGGQVVSGICADTIVIQEAMGEKVQTLEPFFCFTCDRKDKYIA